MFDFQNDPILDIMTELTSLLKKNRQTVATAESCTGGILATLMTHFAGSSSTYLGGVSAYSNKLKEKLLGVPADIIESHGAVSAIVAEKMALGITHISQADFGVSITGIAGPSGGTTKKPVGTIWCGLSTPKGVDSKLYNLGNDRQKNRYEISTLALKDLLSYIKSTTR